MDNGKVFAEILAELREMNRVQRGSGKAIEQMGSYLNDYQKIVDFVLENNQKKHQELMRELRSQFTRTTALLMPELAGAYRQNTRIISSEDDPVSTLSKPYPVKMAENAGFGLTTTNRAFYRTGFRSNLSTTAYQTIDEGFSTGISTTQNLRVVSTSGSDSGTGTGVRTVLLSGLNGSLLRIFETVTMNGTTPVSTVNQFAKFDSLFSTTVGSNGFAVGEITVTDLANTVTYGHIAPGFNAWRSAKFHTSAIDVGYIYEWQIGSYNAVVRGELWCSNVGGFEQGAIIARSVATVSNNTFEVSFPIPIRVAKMGLITVRGLARTSTSETNTSFELYVRQE